MQQTSSALQPVWRRRQGLVPRGGGGGLRGPLRTRTGHHADVRPDLTGVNLNSPLSSCTPPQSAVRKELWHQTVLVYKVREQGHRRRTPFLALRKTSIG